MTEKTTLRRFIGKISAEEFKVVVDQVREVRTFSPKAYKINYTYFVEGQMQVDIAEAQACSGAYVNKICTQFLKEYLDYQESNSHG